MIYRLGNKKPRIHPEAFVAPNATIIGDVVVGAGASVWWNAVIRGDDEQIVIGERTNIQDGCVLHADAGMPLTIGADVTVGHKVMLHGCTIGDKSLIGIGSVVLNRAVIGTGSIVGAASLVTERKEFPENVLIVGSPAKVKKELSEMERGLIAMSGAHYAQKHKLYEKELEEV